jgi:hypothetical protein
VPDRDVAVSHPADTASVGLLTLYELWRCIDLEVPRLSGGTIVLMSKSFAAPDVSGLMAGLLSKHPCLAPYEVQAVLRAAASNAEPKGRARDGS